MMKSFKRIPDALIVWISSYLFFLFTLADNFSASHDSINYLNGIVKNEHLFHQHHLLYHFSASLWLKLFSFTGIAAHYIIESFTALWGSSVLTVVFLFYRKRFYLSRTLSALGVLAVGFSYGMWFYSVNIEVYAPPLFFILVCLYIITGRHFAEKDIPAIAILHSLAILFHQVNILFVPIIIYAIIYNRKNLSLKGALFQYIVLGTIITGSIYFITGWMIEGHNSFPDWIRWMQGYTVGNNYWQLPGVKTPLNVVTGFSHAFIGGHYIFQLPALQQYLQNSFRAHGLRDEIFLSNNISAWTAWFLTSLTVIFSFLFMSLVIRFFTRYRLLRIHSKVVRPLLLCLIIYSVFFCFWMPEILEFWILQMVIVWLLLIGMLPVIRFPFKISVRLGLTVIVICLFIINYFGSIRWLQDIKNDWYYVEVQKIKPDLRQNDLVIVKDGWLLKYYIQYYTPASAISDDDERPAKKWNRIFVYSNETLTLSD